MNEEIKEFKEALDKLKIGYKEIPLGSNENEKADIEIGFTISAKNVSSKGEIENCLVGGRELARMKARGLVCFLEGKLNKLKTNIDMLDINLQRYKEER